MAKLTKTYGIKRGQVFTLDSELGLGHYFLVLEPEITKGYCGVITSMDINFKELLGSGSLRNPDKYCALIKSMSESEIKKILSPFSRTTRIRCGCNMADF